MIKLVTILVAIVSTQIAVSTTSQLNGNIGLALVIATWLLISWSVAIKFIFNE